MKQMEFKKESFLLLSFGLCVVYVALHLTGCSYHTPKIDVTFWAGDSIHSGISRSQDGETISCSDAKIDDYVALTYEDLKKIYQALLQCKEWGVPVANDEEMKAQYIHNNEVIKHVLSTKKRE